ncbi:MAG: hypothetical protein DU429_08005 [Candidatus Tokpelaia sp.]|nr:MAG: hypothetical protein DU429_08005 [Candidatus Tokpelaia sp.]KAA6206078.1 MAG: hypothetical protein DU430_02260 [Candidatus Tokpelaia sp.]
MVKSARILPERQQKAGTNLPAARPACILSPPFAAIFYAELFFGAFFADFGVMLAWRRGAGLAACRLCYFMVWH